MNDLKDNKFLLKGLISAVLLLSFVNNSIAGDASLSSSIDCSTIRINYIDRPDMTQSERIEAMNKAFFESINQFELCNLSTQTQSQPESQAQTQSNPDLEAGESSEGGQESDNSSNDSSEAAQESVASSSMVGTESESIETDFDSSEEISKIESANDTSIAVYDAGANGKIPEDIPEINNDDAVAAQIRLAAEIEKDPVKKEKLWNEYRKYKGLPVKK